MGVPYVGVAYRPQLHRVITQRKGIIDVIEVMVDHYVAGGPALKEKIEEAASIYPVVAHGVGLSLGSATLPDARYLEQVAAVIEKLGAINYSEHLAFTKSTSLDTSQLLPVPRTPEFLEILVENIAVVQKSIAVPFLIENITYYFDYASAQIPEPEFLSAIIAKTQCGLLLDIENLYINSINHSFSSGEFLDALPQGAVRAMHVAGGGEHDGVLIDTHDRTPPSSVLELMRKASERWEVGTVILERDENIEDPNCVIEDVILIKGSLVPNEKRRTAGHPE